MREPHRTTPLIIDETELHLRMPLPVRKADDLPMRQSGFLPNLRVM